MFLEDTIEFYGFLPEQLLQEIEDEIRAEIETKNELLDLHLPIFSNYVLKTCFFFPEGFSFERKITDKRINISLQGLIDDCLHLKEEIRYLKNEKTCAMSENAINRYLILNYNKACEDLKMLNEKQMGCDSIEGRMREVELRLGESNLVGNDKNESGIGMLLENENFRREVENKEREDLLRVYDVYNIEEIIKEQR